MIFLSRHATAAERRATLIRHATAAERRATLIRHATAAERRATLIQFRPVRMPAISNRLDGYQFIATNINATNPSS